MDHEYSHGQNGLAVTNGAAAAAISSAAGGTGAHARRPPPLRGLLMSLLDATPGMVVVSDTDGSLFYMNALGRARFGVGASDGLAGRNVSEFYPEGGFDRILNEALPVALERGVWRGESVLIGAGRTEIPVSQVLMAHHMSRGAEQEPVVALSSIAWDMREHSRKVARLGQQATHDAVTGLPNRTLLMDRLKQALRSAQRHGHAVAVFFVDVDDFRRINAEFGHQAGSTMLSEFAHRLKSGLRAEDTVARYGGDEFVLLVRDISTPVELVRSRLMTAIYRALTAPFAAGEAWLSPSVSVGVAVYPEDGRDAATLLRRAGSKMHRLKRHVDSARARTGTHDRRSGDPPANTN